jgi:hypothetical protein
VSYDDKALAAPPPASLPQEKPAWLAALDGLCTPCADAEFYGTRIRHADCEHGSCACAFEIPAVWPAGTWGA